MDTRSICRSCDSRLCLGVLLHHLLHVLDCHLKVRLFLDEEVGRNLVVALVPTYDLGGIQVCPASPSAYSKISSLTFPR
jgi:hypothetical protein